MPKSSGWWFKIKGLRSNGFPLQQRNMQQIAVLGQVCTENAERCGKSGHAFLDVLQPWSEFRPGFQGHPHDREGELHLPFPNQIYVAHASACGF